MAANELLRRLASFGKSGQSSGRGHDLPQKKPGVAHDASRNPASLAVARNCGVGSSCLNAEVKVFETLRRQRLKLLMLRRISANLDERGGRR
jgi:hypothetical protein